jgi:hypothetical protein
MSNSRRFAAMIGLALGCGLSLDASAAAAAPRDERPRPGAEEQPGQSSPKRGPKADKPAFPMPAPQFKEKVEQRLERIENRLERALAKRALPPGIERQIRADFAQGAGAIRAAANKAGADGTVTKQEAKQVRELARDLRDQAKEKYGPQIRPRKPGPKARG